jgi:hypothetical protein
MISATQDIFDPKVKQISYKNWLDGYISELDQGRTPGTGLSGAGNVMLYQNGTVGPRPSLAKYGPQFLGTLLGIEEMVQYTTSGVVKWLITVQNVSGTAKVYIARGEDATWTVCNGKTYDLTARCRFLQVDDKMLVMNSKDNLSYFDMTTIGATNTVVPFTALLNPSAPSGFSKTGLVGTNLTYYYKIAANNTVGTTAASASGSITVGKLRDTWISGTDGVTFSWTAVADAVSYNIYVGDVSGQEVYLTTVNGISFTDDGSIATDVTKLAPPGNSTAGPKVGAGIYINGQVYLYLDGDNPRYVWAGGTGNQVLDFSPFGGIGWVEVARGGKEFPASIKPFRKGSGSPAAILLTNSTNGFGKRFILTPSTVTVGETIISYLDVQEDNGQDGTSSTDGVIPYNDALWYPSKDNFKTTYTKQQVQTILSTDGTGDKILSDIRGLNQAAMSGCIGLAYQNRLYWAVPNGSTKNNQIWILDLARKSAWMLPWYVSADWMLLYEDNTSQKATRFLIVSDNTLYEFTYNQATTDDATAFSTDINSGIIKFSDNGLMWADVIDVTFVFGKPQGTINVSISGKTEEGGATTVGSETVPVATSIAGWGEAGWGGNYWSEVDVVPIAYGEARVEVTVEPEDSSELNWLTWNVTSTDKGVNYQLYDVIVRYVEIGNLSLE